MKQIIKKATALLITLGILISCASAEIPTIVEQVDSLGFFSEEASQLPATAVKQALNTSLFEGFNVLTESAQSTAIVIYLDDFDDDFCYYWSGDLGVAASIVRCFTRDDGFSFFWPLDSKEALFYSYVDMSASVEDSTIQNYTNLDKFCEAMLENNPEQLDVYQAIIPLLLILTGKDSDSASQNNNTAVAYGDNSSNESTSYNSSNSSSYQSSANKTEPVTDNDELATCWSLAEEVVLSQLKAPNTAEFPRSYISDGVSITKSGNVYTVKAWVDAENSFGAMLRSNFSVTMEKTGYGSNVKFTALSCIIE